MFIALGEWRFSGWNTLMLWLAGLMGLMAVGAVSFIEPQPTEDDDDAVDPAQRAPDVTAGLSLGMADIPEDNLEPDYDPRGGDDAALLPPLVQDEAEAVTLLSGTDYDDVLAGEDGNDRIRGLNGADDLNGGIGNDELRGDAGDDTLSGAAGNDTLHGQDGDDVMLGGDAQDVLFGHNANDNLSGGTGDDALQGSAGDDLLEGGEGNDTLQGGLDNDTLVGGAGADVLFGGWGNDVLSGLERNATGGDDDVGDFLNGGGGDDSILVGAGDFVTAGDGADEIVLGDWLANGEAAQIMDYTASDDSLVLVWDDSLADTAEPQITLVTDPEAQDQTLVYLDDAIVASVNGTDLMPGDIALIPLSTATQFGLADS